MMSRMLRYRPRREAIEGSALTVLRLRSRVTIMNKPTNDADRLQLDIQRRMSPEQRLRLAFEMSDLARDLSRARIRQQHPDWSGEQVTRELVRAAFSPQPSPW